MPHCLHNPLPWHYFFFFFTLPYIFIFQSYLMFFTSQSTLCMDSLTVQSFLLSNENFLVLVSTSETNCCICCSLEINDPLGPFQHFLFTANPQKKKGLCHQAYLWMCMHGNSCLELPKPRIT